MSRARTSSDRWRRGKLMESLIKEESEGLDTFQVVNVGVKGVDVAMMAQ